MEHRARGRRRGAAVAGLASSVKRRRLRDRPPRAPARPGARPASAGCVDDGPAAVRAGSSSSRAMAVSRSPSTAASAASGRHVVWPASESKPAASAWARMRVDQVARLVDVARLAGCQTRLISARAASTWSPTRSASSAAASQQRRALVQAVGVDHQRRALLDHGRQPHVRRGRGPRPAPRPCRPTRTWADLVAQHVRLGDRGHGPGPLLVVGQPVDRADQGVGERAISARSPAS